MTSQKRKKWSEAEEKTLIEKYEEMVADGTLAKMKTREKKFKPVACYVNSVHHACDPVLYPWQWTWKDVSTKVQNMRHQYLLVKQKIRRADGSAENSGVDSEGDFDWFEGLTHWSNFLRYKEIFGDVPLSCNPGAVSNGTDLMVAANEDRELGAVCVGESKGLDIVEFGSIGHSCDADFGGMDGVENGVLCLGFDYDGEEAEGNCDGNERLREEVDDTFACNGNERKGSNLKKKKKRKVLKGLEKKAFGFLASQLRQLRELEGRFELRDAEREQEKQTRENLRSEHEAELKRKLEEKVKEEEEREKVRGKRRIQLLQEWEPLEKESEERLQRRREEEMIQEREWEERMNRRRAEWKKTMDDMLSQHRAEMSQMQNRFLNEQHNLTSQFLGMLSQWTGHPEGLADHTTASSHYFSQMMQNLHHVNGMVHGDARVDGDNQDDQFIVDG